MTLGGGGIEPPPLSLWPNSHMAFEIDVLPVGESSKSGDAICLRFGSDLYSATPNQTVVLIDGGFASDGARVVEHVRTHYRTDRVDLVVSTHPDGDHVKGLPTVLRELEVGQLWMHLPWRHSVGMAGLFSDGRVTDNSMGERLRAALNGAHVLAETADEMGVPVVEPFAGVRDQTGSILTLGPDSGHYEALLLELLEAKKEASGRFSDAFGTAVQTAVRAVTSVAESFGVETLTDDGEVSPINNSSTVLLFEHDGVRVLFTGDAGPRSLTRALDVMTYEYGVAPSSLGYVQVPHHGSRRNVGPTLLDRLVGNRLSADQTLRTAFASAAANGSPKHPSKRVLNAFRRRGAPVYVTAGRHWLFGHGVSRPGWSAGSPEPFHYTFDE